MRLKKIVRDFENHSVAVTGMKGCGKDVLLGNVIARRGLPYVSNLNYGGRYHSLNLSDLDLGGNSHLDFINDTLTPYVHKYPLGADIYISDVGVYLPSQYCNELNKKFPYLPIYIALSRQISRNAVHFNVQNLNRCWDKFREMASIFYRCVWCKVLFGKIVIMRVVRYDKAESCQARVKPCRIRKPLICGGERRTHIEMYKDNFYNTYGDVRSHLLVFWNRSKHDTYEFEKKLKVVYAYEEEKNS